MHMFAGREKEAESINKTLDNKSSAIMLYGKRKVGKTTLIKEVLMFILNVSEAQYRKTLNFSFSNLYASKYCRFLCNFQI